MRKLGNSLAIIVHEKIAKEAREGDVVKISLLKSRSKGEDLLQKYAGEVAMPVYLDSKPV
jgi:hypothetical protein